jgi:hypothetical protein
MQFFMEFKTRQQVKEYDDTLRKNRDRRGKVRAAKASRLAAAAGYTADDDVYSDSSLDDDTKNYLERGALIGHVDAETSSEEGSEDIVDGMESYWAHIKGTLPESAKKPSFSLKRKRSADEDGEVSGKGEDSDEGMDEPSSLKRNRSDGWEVIGWGEDSDDDGEASGRGEDSDDDDREASCWEDSEKEIDDC